MAVVDAEEIALAVVGIVDNIAVWQGFSYEAAGVVSRVAGNELTAIVAVFGFFRQIAVEVIHVSRALAVKADFLLDKAVGVVIEQEIGFDEYDPQNRLTAEHQGWGTLRYGYDALGQLLSETNTAEHDELAHVTRYEYADGLHLISRRINADGAVIELVGFACLVLD